MCQQLACGLTRAEPKQETGKLVAVPFQTLLYQTCTTREVKLRFAFVDIASIFCLISFYMQILYCRYLHT